MIIVILSENPNHGTAWPRSRFWLGEAVWETAWILKHWDFQWLVSDFHPKTIRNPLGIGQIGFVSSRKEGEDTQGGVVRMGCREVLIIEFGLVLGDLREGPRKRSFAPDWTLSGSRCNSMIGYLDNSFLSGRRIKLRLKNRSHSLARMEVFGQFCVLDSVLALSVLKHNDRVVLFLSWSIVVTGVLSDVCAVWNYSRLTGGHNSPAVGASLQTRGCFSLSQAISGHWKEYHLLNRSI